MGFRRRTRRRALVAGAMMEHHYDKGQMQEQDAGPASAAYDQGPPQVRAPSGRPGHPARTPRPAACFCRALTDEEFATAKAQALGS